MSNHGNEATSDGPTEEVLEALRRKVEAFVVRARRIEAHSLLNDKDQFLAWASGTRHLKIARSAGTTEPAASTMTFELPPEEAFESLAARVRPLTLQDEQVHHDKVIKALKAFVRSDPDRTKRVDNLGRAWRKVKKPDHPLLIGLAEDLDKPDQLSSYVDVADAWLYGDLVHCDPGRRQQIGTLTLNQRYAAAVAVYGQAAIYSLAVLNLIRMWQDDGFLGLQQAAFDEPVTVNLPLVVPIEVFRAAPAARLESS